MNKRGQVGIAMCCGMWPALMAGWLAGDAGHSFEVTMIIGFVACFVLSIAVAFIWSME